MKPSVFARFAFFGLTTIIFRRKAPILGTIILTDACNLSCKHCVVNNIERKMHPYDEVRGQMEALYREGIRILFFCGGETLLWKDGDKDLSSLVREAREIGFPLVNVVTNGTITTRIPEASIIFLSLDGLRDSHDAIRGPCFDTIMKNLDETTGCNICVYMAINRINRKDIRPLAELVRNHRALTSISFNFHTPYPGIEDLLLTPEEKVEAVHTIHDLIREGYPVFNLPSVLDRWVENRWERPCRQCIVVEGDKRYICGRCVEIPGLCDQCGYLFAAEFALLFKGNLPAIFDMIRIYTRYS
jgi:MoaA/NifB/PqqE/SkfB family radical SAM enzyme